jgi:ribonuclease T2
MRLSGCANWLVLVLSVSIVGILGTNEWDHFMFVRIWPEAMCRVSNALAQGNCVIPDGTTFWTIHGLWPSEGNTDGPGFCNSSAKFQLSPILSIEKTLEAQWPNLYPSQSQTSLWKHEWEKHGTCVLNFPPLAGEMNYFSYALTLNQKFDVQPILAKSGIFPNETRVLTVQEVKDAIHLVTQAEPFIYCVYVKHDVVYLADIRICYSPDFQPIDCSRYYRDSLRLEKEEKSVLTSVIPTVEPCPTVSTVKMYYPPIIAPLRKIDTKQKQR